MRRLKYYVACTVDHYIARQDGSFDFFLTGGEHLADLLKQFPETIPGHLRHQLGITAENQCFDAVLMGHKTYGIGLSEGITNPYPQMRQYLFSHSLNRSPDPNIELVSSDAVAFTKALKQQAGQDIWLCGGGTLAAALFSEIDEFILKVHPVLLGAGIPLFTGSIPQTALALIDHKIYANGVMMLHYQTKH
ncbi:dihydrofolate reductase family protein [Leptolyngbya sp. AN03gr2]|uniref:dihydrofolate reductase family protein n=1 Tax=unclassified Leptolyngbya TaxID=2650499 RepID=UPI003D314897